MFTGFASENTPSVKVWDFSKPQSGSALPVASLEDDCATNQIFFTGGSVNNISVYLPNATIAGKTITIRNEPASGSDQRLNVFDNAQNQTGWSYLVGQGLTIVFLSIDNLAAFRNSATSLVSCSWIILSGGQYYGGQNFGSSVLSGFGNRANGNSVNAVVAGGTSNRTNASRAAVIGGDSNLASGTSSFVGSGASNTASGGTSFVAGGSSNTASNTTAAVVGGSSNTSAGDSCVVLGGTSNQAVSSGSWSLIAAGTNNYISANSCGILAGQNNTTSGDMSVVSGGRQGTTRSIIGYTVSPASSIPISNIGGVNQTALLVLARQTTDATATVIRSNGATAGTTNQVILPNNSAYYFRGECIAGVTGAGDTKGWYIEGVIKRGANAASTAIVGAATVTSLYADAGATTWAVTATADTTNGGLAITVTGQAATTIRWVCQIRTTEMTY